MEILTKDKMKTSFQIVHPRLEHLDEIVQLANDAEFIVPNTRMIYWMCCSIFSNFSFIAIEEDEIIGLLFALPDPNDNSLWVHQLFVKKEYQRQKVAERLSERLDHLVVEGGGISSLRCAVKPNNLPSKSFVEKRDFILQKLDSHMDMYIYVKYF